MHGTFYNVLKEELFPQYVGVVPPEAHEAVFDCTVREGFGDPAHSRLLWDGIAHLPLEVAPSVDDVMTPVRDSALTEAVRRALRMELLGSCERGLGTEHHELGWRFSFGMRRAAEPALRDIAVGLRIDLMRNDESLGTAMVLPQDFFTEYGGGRFVGVYVTRADFDESFRRYTHSADRSEEDKRWQMRVRGDGEAALTDWDRDKYWAGEFAVPLFGSRR